MTKTTLILHNANILTMNSEYPCAQAVAIGQEGRIQAVGNSDEVLNLAGSGCRVVNLNGQTVIPGFFDCHLHILWLGNNLGQVDLSSPPVKNKEDIIRLLKKRLIEKPDALSIQGNRYDQNKLPGARHITRFDLDKVASHIPVRVEHTSGHASIVNTKALEMLGINVSTENPQGGEIGRDESGFPNGLLLESASWNNLEQILPKAATEEAVDSLGRANRYLLERGITSASDADTFQHELDWYARAVHRETLQVRTNLMINWASIMEQAGEDAIPSQADIQPAGSTSNWHRLHVGQAKLFSDGAITTRTCWNREPFEGASDNYGIAMHTPEDLRHFIISAHNAGWQIAAHAIGDRAIDEVLTCYALAQRQNTRHRPGHRIEHCMLLDDDLISRMRRQNVWSIGQPEFISQLGDAYILALGEARANRLSPYASLENRGVAQAFSSDCPVVPGSPLDGIAASMTRLTPQGKILNDTEKVGVETALYSYTAAPSYATKTERDRGSIESGKWADFVLLNKNPLNISLEEWSSLKVDATIVGGVCLFGGL